MSEKKNRKGLLLALKILSVAIYFAVTAFLLIYYIDVVAKNEKDFGSAVAILFAGILFFGVGAIVYIAAAVLGVVGFIISMTKGRSLADKIYFAVATLLPIVTGLIWIVLFVRL